MIHDVIAIIGGLVLLGVCGFVASTTVLVRHSEKRMGRDRARREAARRAPGRAA